MGNSAAVRHLVDLLMTVVLVLLMAYFLTDQEIHEWLGAGMLVLFIAHHMLNRTGLKALNQGKYTPFRVLQTALVLLVLLCIVICVKAYKDVFSHFIFNRFEIE